MRSRWEDRGEVDLDAPTTITERELRALRRRSGVGVMGLLLALASVGGLGWTLFTGSEGLAQIQNLKERILPGTTAGTEAEIQETQSSPPEQSQSADSARMQPLAADSLAPAQPASSRGD